VVVQIDGDDTPEKKRIAAEANRAVELFRSLDVRRVQDACNERREVLLRAAARYCDDESFGAVEPGLAGLTVGTARRELARPFQLVPPPQPITINLRYDSFPLAPNTPAFVVPGDPNPLGVVYVLADNIDAANLCARDTRGALLDYVLHEMLHLSGDAVRDEDGVVRMQLAGTGVVKELLGFA
jgi:hypothetical protein